ncbi:MAG: DUF192 domain-containing protein [Lentisphaerae bacterium]|nr:DUF192 domain-containing protein [Lentisphaerota bacterium]
MRKIIMIALGCLSCLLAEQGKRPQYWPLQIGDLFFARIELALTEAENQIGLMGRKTLEEDQGMLFVRDHEEIMFFWMKNTLVPLDIVFLDRNGVVVKIRQMPVEAPQGPQESLDEYHQRLPTYSSEKPAAFALELKSGITDILQLKPGDRIDLNPDQLRKLLETK